MLHECVRLVLSPVGVNSLTIGHLPPLLISTARLILEGFCFFSKVVIKSFLPCLEGHLGCDSSVRFSADGSHIMSGSDE